MTYAAYQIRLSGELQNRENLNNLDELNAWIASKYGKFATIKIVADNGNWRTMTDNGVEFEVIAGSHLN